MADQTGCARRFRLIFGDNLLALTALEQAFTGQAQRERKPCNCTATATQTVHHFRETVTEASRIGQMLFSSFAHCLYPLRKFGSLTDFLRFEVKGRTEKPITRQ